MAAISNRRLATLLALTPGIGGKSLIKILARCDLMGIAPGEFVRLSREELRESFGLTVKQAEAVASRKESWNEEVAGVERRLTELGVRLITAADADYPARLEQFDPQAPPALFCYGNLRLLGAKTFSILSSRNAPPKALDRIEKLTEEGVFQSEVLITGHDRPEYQRSAIVPLRWGSPRILCFDRGMFQVLGEDLSNEPFRAARLWRYQFDAKTDLAISPFKPDSSFRGVNNQVRDRLVAALSDRIDFPHLSSGGNMEKLARLALKANRSVRVDSVCETFEKLVELGADVLSSP
jgi:DNA processing protein